MPSRIVDGLRQAILQLGRWDGSLYALSRAIARVTKGRITLRKYYFFAQPVADKPLLAAHKGKTIEVFAVDQQHPLVQLFPRPPTVIARRFGAGAVCFSATKNDSFVGFLWLQPATYVEDEVRSRFTPLPQARSIWDFDVHLEEAHRGSLAFARLWDKASEFLRNAGIEWSMSRISAFNSGSLASHIRLGARPLASATYVSGHRWQLMISDISPYVHFSTSAASVPELHLHADRADAFRYRRFAPKGAKLA